MHAFHGNQKEYILKSISAKLVHSNMKTLTLAFPVRGNQQIQ